MPAATSPGRAGASRTIVALVLIVIALSAVVRLVDLSVFPTLVFDEHYYVHDANSVLHGRIGPRAPSPWKPGDGRSLAHPPLGVLSIAAGITALGNDPWGWRVPSALAGTALIALVYPLARRLRLSPRWALAALVLAASDTMLIAESRIGVLDSFVALWSAVCVYCALRYVQSGRPARWLALTGLAGGLAVASKWSGALALIAAIAIVALDAWRRRRAAATAGAGAGRSATRVTGSDAGAGQGATSDGVGVGPLRAALLLLAVPLAVYLASYAAYFASGHTPRQWLHLQGYMATFNWGVQGSSVMASRPPTWIFDAYPIWYRWALTPRGVVGLIAIGNPLLLWGSIAACLGLVWLAARRRDASLAAAPLLAAVLYLPWLATSRQSYIYYLTPAIPFLAIAVAAALAQLSAGRSPAARPAALCCAAGAVVVALAAGGTPVLRVVALAALAATLVVAARLTPPEAGGQRPGLTGVAPWLFVGAVVGLAVAWLPFVVAHATSFGYYARLAWLTSWR
jgi:dolichyl-phosphate-mannose-protein mannosyltransferase